MEHRATALVIDDNEATATALEVVLSLHDIVSVCAHSAEEGLKVLAQQPVDIVFQDMNFSVGATSGEEGKALFAAVRERYPEIPIILLTAWTDLSSAVDLVKAGAVDYISKPWDDHRLITTVMTLLKLKNAQDKLAQAEQVEHQRQRKLAKNYNLCGMVYADPAMEMVIDLAAQVARSEVPVLITGPNGSGKERIAEIIQKNSLVSKGPFVSVDCGALPSELIEAELFGAEEGAYTGASRAREGKFEAAHEGTLFLDEIGNMSLSAQMKLLRVLETGRFTRLGSNRERHAKVRVISATNTDLVEAIREGLFREDLYYRIHVIEVKVPALKDRPKDILVLAKALLGAEAVLERSAEAALQAYHWPGNVRELRNTMQRAALLAKGGNISVEHLRLPSTTRALSLAPATQASALAPNVSAEEVKEALRRHRGVISRAANELGVSRQTVYRLINRWGIQRGLD